MSSSSPYTLENFLLDARVPRPAPFAKYLEMAFTPRADQVVGLNRTLINTRFGLFDDPGCGKTVQMQAQAMQMIAEGNKVMMLMPPVLLGQFVESLCETFTEPYRYFNWHVLNQGPAPREVLFERWEREGCPELLLMSY